MKLPLHRTLTRSVVALAFSLCCLLASCTTRADTQITLLESYAGNVNFIGTQKTLRTQPNSVNPCSVVSSGTTTSATLSGLPATASVRKAYLYWAGSGSTPDYTVTFEGKSRTATRQYVSTDSGSAFFNGVVDVTADVTAKKNGSYSFSGLTVDSWTGCNTESVLAGWALLVIYEDAGEPNRVLNLYEGFQYYQNSSITLNISNFQIPTPIGSATAKHGHITWEGDPTLYGGGENLTFNGYTLSDANNPAGNQFNSYSNINNDPNSYGIDFDAYAVGSPIIQSGQTSATVVYSSGQDLVLLSAEILAVPNIPVADRSIAMSFNGPLARGQNVSYTLTVSNNGPNTETNAKVTNILPADLSYVSATGTGWSCPPPVGKTITCSTTTPIASGTSAPTITLTALVSNTASGTITNTATVSGALFDNISGNDTATDNQTFTVAATAYAAYLMDQAANSWNGTAGEVRDSSVFSRNGTRVGTANVSTPTAPYNYCRAANIPDNSSNTTQDAVSVPIKPQDLGTSGTIAFWFNSNSKWKNSAAMLLDASTGSSATSPAFWLMKNSDGTLLWTFTDGAPTPYTHTLTSSAKSFGANTWHHIAIAWQFVDQSNYWGNPLTMNIYIDGSLANNVFGGTQPWWWPSGSLPACVTGYCYLNPSLATLYLGDNRTSGITPSGGSGNSANGLIDETYFFNRMLSASEIGQLMNATHACTTVDHYELSLPTESLSCQAATATVTACADSGAPCTNKATGVSGGTAKLATNAGSLAATTLTFDSNGTATTTLSYPSASDGTTATLTLSGESIAANNSRKCCPDGANCTTADSCGTTFKTAGFIFANTANGAAMPLANQIAGVSSGTYYLRAVKTGTSTKACEAALTGSTAVNFAYECNNPATCYADNLMSLNAGSATTISRNDKGSITSYTPVNMDFDANGNAKFTLNYSDVGQIKLYASKAASGSLLAGLSGASNAFVVKPYSLVLSDIKCNDAAHCAPGAPTGNNPAASDATGASFIRAGDPFSITVTAITQNNTATPSFGKETPAEGVKLSQALLGGLGLSANPTLSGNFGAFSNGAASGTAFSWDEVGIITLTPSIADGDYLGAGNVTGSAVRVGRFIPHHFAITKGAAAPGCGAAFTYFGQDGFTTPFTLTAQNASNGTTTNYNGSFAKLALNNWNNFAFTATATPALPAGAALTASTAAPIGAWNAGSAAISAKHQISRPAALAGETAVTVQAQPVDSDGVTTSTASAVQDAATNLRYGRIRMQNANGSELLDLRVPLRAEYWTGNTDGWQPNALDTCSKTTLSFAQVGGTNITGRTCILDSGSPGASGKGCAAAAGNVTKQFLESGVTAGVRTFAGDFSLWLRAPGAGNNGALTIDAAVDPWLQFNWTGVGLANPSARATFGVAKSGHVIHRREMY